MTKLNFTLLIFTLLALSASCKKIYIKEIETVEKKTVWTEMNSSTFSYNDKDQRNVVRYNDSLLLFVNKFSVNFLNANTLQRVSGSFGNAYLSLGSSLVGEKPYLSNKLLITASEQFTTFRLLSNLVTQDAHCYFAPGYNNVDSNFKKFTSPYKSSNTPQISVLDRYFLIPFSSKQNQGNLGHVYLVKLKDTLNNIYNTYAIDNYKTIPLTPTAGISFPNYDGVYSLRTAFKKFFVSKDNNFYRIDTLGNVKSFGAPMYDISGMFIIDLKLFAINPNGLIYVSLDQGETFQLFIDTNNTIYGFLNFKEVNNKVIAYYQDQLFEVILTGTVLTFKELQNEGLKYHKITEIEQCGKRYFVTTLSGVFYRDSVNMFVPKP